MGKKNKKEKKKKRVDVSGQGQTLPDDRFACLATLLDDPLPEHQGVDGTSEDKKDCEKREFSVKKTRKGNFHVSLKKLPGNRVLTVIHNIEGDGSKLLKELKKTCGAGGKLRGDTIELQGDHREAVTALLEKKMAK